MSFVVPNEGEAQMLNVILQKSANEILTLKLFSNNITPAEADTAATYTECAIAGYAAIDFAAAGADHTVTAGTGAPGTTTFASAQKTFTLTGAGTVYGYYVVGKVSGKVYFSEKFTDGPYVYPAGGGTCKVTLGGSLE